MPYSGDVVVGGPTDVRELDELTVRKAAVGPMSNNAYLLTCRASGAQLLIDAADEPDRLLGLVRAVYSHDCAVRRAARTGGSNRSPETQEAARALHR